MLAAKSNVKIDFCAGGLVISLGYYYFSFFSCVLQGIEVKISFKC